MAMYEDHDIPSDVPVTPADVTESHLSRTETIRLTVESLPPIQETIFIFTVCMSQFMTQAALGICLSPLDIIGDSFQITNPGTLSWLIAGYSLTVGTFVLFFGRCGDVFGYRFMYSLGFAWLAIWSMVAGLSVYSNKVLFIFARTISGLGPAMLLPNGLALLGATYQPGRKKYMVFSLFGAMAPIGAVVGAVFSALFAQLAWWPWAFWSMAIYCLLLTILLCSELDILGAFLGVTGLVLVNFAWNQAPVVGWQAPYVYVLLIIGVLFLVSFGTYEVRFAEKPLVPFDTLNLDVSFILACIACGWASFGIWIYYFWLLLKNLRDQTPLQAAAQFVPPAVTGFAASFVAGILMNKVKPGWIMLLALFCFTIGNIFTAIAPVQQTYWGLTFVTLLIMPWGMDMSFPAATVVLSNAVGRSRQGVAASLVSTVVNYSISLGLGFAGTVEVHVNNGGQTPHDLLVGYRGALYVGIGLGGLGIAVSLIYILKSMLSGKS